VTFPIVSSKAVEPWLFATYGETFRLNQGNALVTVLMVAMTVLVPAFLLLITRKPEAFSQAYMSGHPSTPELAYHGAKGVERKVDARNYYMTGIFEEGRILGIGSGLAILFLITIIGTVLL